MLSMARRRQLKLVPSSVLEDPESRDKFRRGGYEKWGFRKPKALHSNPVFIGKDTVIKLGYSRAHEKQNFENKRLREYLHNMKGDLRRVRIPRVIRSGKGWMEVEKARGRHPGKDWPEERRQEPLVRKLEALGFDDIHNFNFLVEGRGKKQRIHLIDLQESLHVPPKIRRRKKK